MHLGIVDEDAINEMSFLFFEDVLEELGHKLTYDAVVNYAGNSFCNKSWDMIIENNPFNVTSSGSSNSRAMNTLVDFINKSDVKVKRKGK